MSCIIIHRVSRTLRNNATKKLKIIKNNLNVKLVRKREGQEAELPLKCTFYSKKLQKREFKSNIA